jgi:hypothetical protein
MYNVNISKELYKGLLTRDYQHNGPIERLDPFIEGIIDLLSDGDNPESLGDGETLWEDIDISAEILDYEEEYVDDESWDQFLDRIDPLLSDEKTRTVLVSF